MISKLVYQKIGGYNDFFDRIGAEDYYWFYLITEKFEVCNIPDALYFYRFNPISISGDWSDNPKKIHTEKILNYLIKQRINNSTDSLELKDFNNLNEFYNELNKEFVNDPSKFYRDLSIKLFYDGQKSRAIKLAFKSFKKNPIKKENIKNLTYFIRNYGAKS